VVVPRSKLAASVTTADVLQIDTTEALKMKWAPINGGLVVVPQITIGEGEGALIIPAATMAEQIEDIYIGQIVHELNGIHAVNPSTLVRYSSDGFISLKDAATPPTTNPPAGEVYMWVDGDAVYFRNKDGIETKIVPSLGSIYQRITATVSRTSTVLSDNDTLNIFSVDMEAGAIYRISGNWFIDGATAGDAEFTVMEPAADAVYKWSVIGAEGAVTATSGITEQKGLAADYAAGAGNKVKIACAGVGTTFCEFKSTFRCVTAGTFKIRMAQGTSSASATRLLTQSDLYCQRVA
jgi:hypothetical protein